MKRLDRRHFLSLLVGSTAALGAAACGDDAEGSASGDAGFYDDADCPSFADAGGGADASGADAGSDATGEGIASRIAAARDTALAYFRDADPTALDDIGLRYLDAAAPSRSEAELAALLDRVLLVIETAPDEACALAGLQAGVRADFEARLVADLEGWTLSEMELSLAALTAA